MKRTERIEVWLTTEERKELDQARGLTALATWIRANVLGVARAEKRRPAYTQPLIDFLAELELRRDRAADLVRSAREQKMKGPHFEDTLPENHRRAEWEVRRLRSALVDAGIIDAAEREAKRQKGEPKC